MVSVITLDNTCPIRVCYVSQMKAFQENSFEELIRFPYKVKVAASVYRIGSAR